MELGLSSFTYGWAVGVAGREPPRPLDEHGLLDRCHAHGVKLLQIGDNLPLHRFDSARLDRLAARAAAEGIRLEVGARGLVPDHAWEYLRIARRIGARLVRFVVDDAGCHPSPGQVIDVLRQIAPGLGDIVLGLENHDRFRADTLRRIVEGAACDSIGVCLDTANSLGAGEGIETVVDALGPFAVNLHVKDFQISRVPHLMGFVVEGRPAGQGLLDIPWLLERLSPGGRCATAVLESWTPPEPTLEATIAKEENWARQGMDFLKPLFRQSP